jgi:hypothetical protein
MRTFSSITFEYCLTTQLSTRSITYHGINANHAYDETWKQNAHQSNGAGSSLFLGCHKINWRKCGAALKK